MKNKKKVLFITVIGWIISIIAGLRGFPFWYGGFVIFFWLFLGILNYSHKTTLWLFKNNKKDFFKFYFPLLLIWIAFDRFGLMLNFWYYPLYHTFLQFLWVYLVLYSFAGLILIESVYFVSTIYKEKLVFVKRPNTPIHRFVDISDGVLLSLIFLVSILFSMLAIFGVSIPSYIGFLAACFVVAWTILDTVMLKFHVKHWLHYLLMIVISSIITVVFHEIPNIAAREWVYLKVPFLNFQIFGVPCWVIIGWYAWSLMLLRLWTLLILHPKVD